MKLLKNFVLFFIILSFVQITSAENNVEKSGNSAPKRLKERTETATQHTNSANSTFS